MCIRDRRRVRGVGSASMPASRSPERSAHRDRRRSRSRSRSRSPPRRPVAAPPSAPGPYTNTPAARPGDWNCPSCKYSVFASRAACPRCGTQNPNPQDSRPGDWKCPQCWTKVFASKSNCFRCGCHKPADGDQTRPDPGRAAPVGGASLGTTRPGDWTCPSCSSNVFASRTACYKCNAAKPPGVPPTGLSQSRPESSAWEQRQRSPPRQQGDYEQRYEQQRARSPEYRRSPPRGVREEPERPRSYPGYSSRRSPPRMSEGAYRGDYEQRYEQQRARSPEYRRSPPNRRSPPRQQEYSCRSPPRQSYGGQDVWPPAQSSHHPGDWGGWESDAAMRGGAAASGPYESQRDKNTSYVGIETYSAHSQKAPGSSQKGQEYGRYY
eukprot:TRINITY_DN5681_c0_g1_i1.p1 TRINITY_DN5681_c0_g1~~TRINITY_DN5681_c0_g1_i1.p1  ORF type:complete len:380 (+),score=20.53 TRINITY_DN5681_c0_g1_i1:125-1264(+)